MKKLMVKMAGVAPVMTNDIQVDGNNKGKKTKWCKNVIKKIIGPVWPEQSHKAPPEEKKELTAEVIQKLIEEQKFEEASKGLIELEHQVSSGVEEPTLQQKDLESLYEELKGHVLQVIRKSLTETDMELLRKAVQAIAEQESEDARCQPETNNSGRSRPKRWMGAWKECIRQTVEERLNDLPPEEKLNKSSSIISNLTPLGKLFKNDLTHVVMHLKECYPEEFDVCNTYAQHYHQIIKTRTENIAQFELWDKDNYFILCWVQNLYPNLILKSPKLAGHIDSSRLGSLLPQQMIRHLEKSYLHYEVDSVKAHMKKALDLEEELWKIGKEPKILRLHYHSELHIDIIQIYSSGFQRASEIQPEVEDRLAPSLAHELEDLLKRYKTVFVEYAEKNKTQPYYRAICISQLNNCLCLREFLNQKDSKLKDSMRQNMTSLLHQLEDSIYDSLLEDLYVDLKSQFKKMSQGSSPFSYQTMKNIIKTAEDFLEPFNTLMDESYKVLAGKIHVHLIKEHLLRIMKRKVSHKNVLEMQTLANQISENADLIDSFASIHYSCEDWLKPALPKVAEIIRLQDLNAIQLEVATLVQAYPDIRNKQIEAILSMKGNLSRNEIKLILKTADTVERNIYSKPKLFELIKTY